MILMLQELKKTALKYKHFMLSEREAHNADDLNQFLKLKFNF